jgi:hypothetical protein
VVRLVEIVMVWELMRESLRAVNGFAAEKRRQRG